MPPNILGSQQRRPQPRFLFPQNETNFQAGRPQPLSNNAASQPTLFDRPDAFAKNSQLQLPGQGVSTVLDTATQQAQGGAPADNTFAAVGRALLEGMGKAQQEPAIVGQQPPERLDDPISTGSIARAQRPLEEPVSPISAAINPFGAAAQTIGAAVINNPFITRKGRQALREGRLPEFNDIMPAFWRFTAPTTIQALQGLFRSGGQPLHDQEFFANVFQRPLGL